MFFFRFFRKSALSTKNNNNYDEKSRPKYPRKPPNVNDISVQPVSIDKLLKDEVIIAILGSTGSGKSSFINMASGSRSNPTEVGHSLKSCTKDIDAFRVKYPGFSVVLVDTPGFDNNQKMPDVKILDMISKWLKETYKQDILLTAILYFHKISDNRMAGPPFSLLRKFQKLCGKEAPKHIIFVTTMWDETDDVEGEKREEQLKVDYWKTMIDLGTRTRRYWNNHVSAWDIIHLAVEPTS